MTARIICLVLAMSLPQFTRAAIDKADNSYDLNLASSWVGGMSPGAGDVAQWSAHVTTANTTSLGANLSWLGILIASPNGPVTINAGNTLSLGNDGIDLSAATHDLTLNCALELATNQSWPVANGRKIVVGNNVSGTSLLTLTGPGTVTFNGGAGATYTLGTATTGNNALALNGGTLDFESGTLALRSNNNSNDGSHINGNSTFNQSGGQVNSSFYTRLGSGAAGTVSTLSVSGGIFKNTGDILFGFGGNGSGTLTVSNTGVVNTHFLRLGNNAAGVFTINLDGGILAADRLYSNSGTPVVNFNGGTLQANSNPSSPWFAGSVATVLVKNGGAVIDSNGKNITIEPGLEQFGNSNGGLTKLGDGSLTLAGTNTYAGPTLISNGTLAINGRLDGTGTVTVAAGAALGGNGIVAGPVSIANGATLAPASGLFTVGSLTLNPDSTLALKLGAAGTLDNSKLRVNGDLTLDGTIAVFDNGGMSTGAVYSVINYTGSLTDNGLTVSPHSDWDVTVDTSLTNFVRLTATRKLPFIEITNGNFAATSLYTNLTAIIHGSTTNIVWYEVRQGSPTGTMNDFGALAPSTIWPFTVRHITEGTNWVTVFARDNNGTTFSNSIQIVLNLPPDTPVRPRPIPAEIWWGGLSTNEQLLDPSRPWNFVKRYEDGFFFHTAGYGGLTSADKAALAIRLRPYNTKYWEELGGGLGNQTPGPNFVIHQVNVWGAVLASDQNLGLVMSQVTHDYHMEDMQDVCQVNPDWTTNNLIAWWTGDLSVTNTGYPYTSGMWRDIFHGYYNNNPHLKVGQTSQPEYWPWDSYPSMLHNDLSFTVTNPTTSFSFNAHDIIGSFVNMASALGHPYFSLQSDAPWNYFGGLGVGTAAQEATMRQKVRVYEQYLQSRGARHTLICNVSNAGSQPGGNDAQDLYYKNSSLNSMYLHQQEGGRANVYLFESWYSGIPHTAAPESKDGSYANLAMAAIKYLKGIADTNGTLEPLKLTLSSSGRTNVIELRNDGDVMCLPAVVTFEGSGGSNAISYFNASGQDITTAILSAEGYVHTNQLAPGQSTTIKVVAGSEALDRTVTLEAFWNPQDPTGIVRDRLTLSPPNQSPTLAAISNQTLIAGQTLVITNNATDPDLPSQTLSFRLLSAPAGASLNPTNGVFTWRPTIAQSPIFTQVKLAVTDNGSPALSATQSFWVTVNQPAPPVLGATGWSNGTFSLLVSGDAGPDYIIQATTNLSFPTVWKTLSTSNSPMPPFGFSDPAATNFSRRYYRVLLGP